MQFGNNQILQNNKMTAIPTYILIIILNVNGVNSPIKRQNGGWDYKRRPSVCCYKKCTPWQIQTQAQSEKMEKDIPGKCSPKAAEVSIPTSNQADFI
jgi:hypothetical protein